MEETPIVNTHQQTEIPYYNEVLNKRIRPKVTVEDLEPKEKMESTEKSEPVLNKYSFEEVINKSTAYFNGDSLAANVWANKYALKDSEGNLYELTPDDMHHRIAGEIARIEKRYPNPMGEDEIFGLLHKFKYIVPQGSPMARQLF